MHYHKLTIAQSETVGEEDIFAVTAWVALVSGPAIKIFVGTREDCEEYVREITARMNAGWTR